MSRKELVAAATAAGIKKASTIKSAELEKMLNGKRRGRPIVEGSKRQAVLAMRDEKRKNGIEIKRGRPKGSTNKVVEDEVIEVETEVTETEMVNEPEMVNEEEI